MFQGTGHATLSLQGSLNVNQTYTDNLFFQDRNKREDFGTYVGPNLMLLFENSDIVLGATYFGRLLFFQNNPSQNMYFQNANILLDLPFLKKRYQKLDVKVHENMTFTPQLDPFFLSESQGDFLFPGMIGAGGISGGTAGQGNLGGGTGFGGGTGGFGAGGIGGVGGMPGIFTQRASAIFNNAGITIGYDLTPQLTPTVGYNNQYLRFLSGGFQDYMMHMGTFSLPYGLSEGTSVTPAYTYRQIEFLGDSTGVTFGNRIVFHDATLQISHELTPSWTILARGGVSFIRQESATEQIFDSTGILSQREIGGKFVGVPIGLVSISKNYRRGMFNLMALQMTTGGGGLAAQGAQTRVVTTQLVHQFGPRATGFVFGAYAQNKSIDGSAFDVDTYRGQVGLSYLFLRWLSGSVAYSYVEQQSKGTAANDLTVNMVMLSLSAWADPWHLMR